MGWEYVAIFVVGTLLLLGAFWIYCLDAAIHNMRHARTLFHRGNPVEVPEVDHTQLQLLTNELERLGFQTVGDIITYQQQPDPDGKRKGSVQSDSTGVLRVMSGHGCYASLISVHNVTTLGPGKKPLLKTTPFSVGIVSMSDPVEGWTYATHNQEINPFIIVLRRSRGLSHFLAGAPVSRLVETHLTERMQIARRGGFTWDPEPTLEKWEAYEQRTLQHIRNVMIPSCLPKAAWTLLTFRFKNHNDWMGELSAKR